MRGVTADGRDGAVAAAESASERSVSRLYFRIHAARQKMQKFLRRKMRYGSGLRLGCKDVQAALGFA